MENLNDMLKLCCTAIAKAKHPHIQGEDAKGIGSKTVGAMLFPELSIAQAQSKLLDCLNPERPHKLSLDQVVFVLREAGKAGFHEGMNYLCADAGYCSPQPITPQDEKAQLQKDFIAAQKAMPVMLAKMETLG